MKSNKLILVLALAVLVLTTSLSAKDGVKGKLDIDKACDFKLIKKLDNEKVKNRTQAALELATKGCPTVQDKLIEMAVKEPSAEARIVAIVSLSKIGDDSAVKALKQLFKEEQVQTVKNVITGAINRLESKQLASM